MIPTNSTNFVHNSHFSLPNSGSCACNENSSDNYIIRLHKPWHHFDSNHWFHSK